MDPALHELLRSAEAEDDREIEALIRLRHPDDRVPGVRLVARFGPVATCRILAADVHAVWRNPATLSLKAPRSYRPELVTDEGGGVGHDARARPDRRVLTATRPPTLTGAGVIVGVVDWSLDFAHPEFRTKEGRTRLLGMWDQRTQPGRPPTPYGYGRLHTRVQIDAALRTLAPYEALGYHPGDSDRKGRGAHGTHVASLAVGSSLPGAAHGADLVFVHLADRDTSGLATMGDSVRLLEAIDLVRRIANHRGRPWVINLSMGRHGGPHDGRTLVEMALDGLLASTPGSCIVQSAGNYYLAAGHATGRLGQGEIRALQFRIPLSDPTPNEVEVWYRGVDCLDVRITPPSGPPGAWLRPGSRTSVRADGRQVGRIYHRAHDPNNGDNQVDAFLDRSAPAGQWTMELRGTQVEDGRFHVWIERDELGQVRFLEKDSSRRSTTGTIANGRLPLCVGASAVSKPGAARVWAKSSAGPTTDGRAKPDCCAPGENVLGARSAPRGSTASPGSYVRMSGTSMAAPAVTAAVARILEAKPGLKINAIRSVLLRSTQPGVPDAYGRAGVGHLDLPRLTAALRGQVDSQSDAEAADVPAYVQKARAIWNQLHLPSNVKIRPLKSAPSTHIRNSSFQAWTNSATEVYVSDVGGDEEAWKFVLYHEAVHVRQFLEWGRPISYAMMMLFEQQAYAETSEWGRSLGLDQDYVNEMAAAAQAFTAEIERVRKRRPEVQEADFKRYLIRRSLPDHKKIADLYDTWPATQNRGRKHTTKSKPLMRDRRGSPRTHEGDRDVAEFEGREHRAVADAGVGGGSTSLVCESAPKALGVGEVVAMAGDYFASYDQMRELARSSMGRAQLAHARWLATAPGLGATGSAEPTGDLSAIQAVRDRAARLAAGNISHFSAEGANWREYSSWHAKALSDAVGARPGRDDRLWRQALSKEAFGLHFLTDAFSAGHVRTPRGDIQVWYAKRYPGSKPLIDYLAEFMFDRLAQRNKIPASGLMFSGRARETIAEQIRERAGAAADVYSLGDIVSLALHDFDGNGLNVVSQGDFRGRPVPGGYHWRAIGDGRLPLRPPGTSVGTSRTGTKPNEDTWRMAVAAVKASVRELDQVHTAGLRAGAGKLSAPLRSDIIRRTLAADGQSAFAARLFVPCEDAGKNPALRTTSGTRAPLDWHWKSLGPLARAAVDRTMRERIPAELAALLDATNDPDQRAVLGEFLQHLKDNGISVLEKVYP